MERANQLRSLPRSQQHPGSAALLSSAGSVPAPPQTLPGPHSIPSSRLSAGLPAPLSHLAGTNPPLLSLPLPTFFDLFVYFFPWQPPVPLRQTAQAPYNLKLICLTAALRQEGWEFI